MDNGFDIVSQVKCSTYGQYLNHFFLNTKGFSHLAQ
jgi:hypothetical protein